MAFHKVDPMEEIKKSIDKNPGLEIYMKQADAQYKLIKSLVEFRKSAGITQKEVAERSGLTQQMVSRMEKIDNSPTLDTFLRYVLALGLELKLDGSNVFGAGNGEEACCVV
ncbi:XRE family transcriptional regulator [Clostridium botulinum]|uniref:helix-turn-helix domain-containing protein n=1 Tax=Clostridium TaxID=1485 RepID=UPI0005EFC83F|nr:MULTISPECIES: helix-turn-helix transcriptional regulator [Clostridium]NEZ85885.1 XRE family transcriptional regulator [Clostridium botulinum]NFE32345.1 XRE family transcriptional regulator [Clostridium botulinum]RFM18513.1 XRE family transcriptional regulator [Clostridium botulinum]WCJ71988.1 helix-turn-helix domain-containing protein [Clostridium botulinum]WCJ75827.1 helix-turn-helix domain-containing protein [Clostridium botulinum]